VEKCGVGRILSSKQPDMKKGGESKQPKRERGRGRGKAKGKRSVKDAIVASFLDLVLSPKYQILAAVVRRHLDCKRKCQFCREQRLAIAINRNGRKRKRPVTGIQRALAGDDIVFFTVVACQ